jgi:tetratricopeptide (TPR) repeat protein
VSAMADDESSAGRVLDVEGLAEGLDVVSRVGLVTKNLVRAAETSPVLARLLTLDLLGGDGISLIQRAGRLEDVLGVVLERLGEGRLAQAADALLSISPHYRGHSYDQRYNTAAFEWNPDYKEARYFGRARGEVIRAVAVELARYQEEEMLAHPPADEVDDAEDASAREAVALVRESLDRLFTEDPGAASWLAVFAHFSAEPIPMAPLEAEAVRGLPHVKGRLDLRPLSEYVEQLSSAGLVAQADEGSFVVPAAISTATLAYLSDELRQRALRAAIVLLGMAFPSDCDDQRGWHIYEALVPHVVAVASAAESVPIGREDAATMFKRATAYYRSRAQFDKAIAVGRRAVDVAERAYGTSSPMLTGALGNLAHALMDNGELVEAEEMFRRVIVLEEDEASTSSVERAETLGLYGNLLRHMRRLSDAESAQRRALALFGPKERPRAFWRITNDLALTLVFQERLEEALPLFREALTGLDGAYGTRAIQKNIGMVLIDLGHMEDAGEILREALADQEALPVPDEGFMAWVYRHLADVYRATGDPRLEETLARLAEMDQPWVT